MRGGETTPGVLQLAEVVDVAHRHNVRVLVDAASEIYPLERMHYVAQSGADLVCFGAKYLGAQNSAGILCGRKELIQAAKLNGFVGYEAQRSRSLGRGYKLDRQEVIGVTVALREWLTMDHEERLQQQVERIETICQALADLPNVQTEQAWNPETRGVDSTARHHRRSRRRQAGCDLPTVAPGRSQHLATSYLRGCSTGSDGQHAAGRRDRNCRATAAPGVAGFILVENYPKLRSAHLDNET